MVENCVSDRTNIEIPNSFQFWSTNKKGRRCAVYGKFPETGSRTQPSDLNEGGGGGGGGAC